MKALSTLVYTVLTALMLLGISSIMLGCGSGGGGAPLVSETDPDPTIESKYLFRSWIATSGATNQVFDSLRIQLGHYDDALGARLYTVFEELGTWGEADLSDVRTATRENTADFDLMEAWLTNGQDDKIQVKLPMHVGSDNGVSFFTQEIGRLIEVEPGVLNPDAEHTRITRVEIEMRTSSFVSPGQDRNGDGNWTDFSALWSLKFYGYVLN